WRVAVVNGTAKGAVAVALAVAADGDVVAAQHPRPPRVAVHRAEEVGAHALEVLAVVPGPVGAFAAANAVEAVLVAAEGPHHAQEQVALRRRVHLADAAVEGGVDHAVAGQRVGRAVVPGLDDLAALVIAQRAP